MSRSRLRSLVRFGGITTCAALIFVFWPQLDVAVVRQLHGPGWVFPWAEWWPVTVLYRFAPIVGRVWLLAALLLLFWGWRRRGAVSRHWQRRAGMLVLCAVLGSGLVIDVGLKTHWGRARPRDVTEFGGVHTYTPPFQITRECARNCSFVSGHAAIGFSLMAWGAFAAPLRRRRWAVVGLVAGGLIGAARMLQGAHFLSDIVFSGLVIWGVCLAVRVAWLAVVARRRCQQRTVLPQAPVLALQVAETELAEAS